MDMGTGKTDKLGAAIAALPYRSPSAGFRARVLAAVAAEAALRRRLAWAVKGLAALTAGWTGFVGLVSAGAAWNLAAEYAPLAAQPGGAELALRVLAARTALLISKGAAALAVVKSAAAGAQAWLPPVQEIAAAAALGAMLILAASRRTAAQKL